MASTSASNCGLHSEPASSQSLPAPKEEPDVSSDNVAVLQPKKEELSQKMDAGSGSNSQSSHVGAFNSEEYASRSHAHRQKRDIAWGYVSEGRNAQGRKTMICTQCLKVFSGGGIHRMKQHLAGVSGSVSSCPKVDPAVRIAMLASLQENEKKSKERRGEFEVKNPFGRATPEFDGDKVQEGISINEAGASSGKGKRKATASAGIHAFLKGGRDSSQTTIKACLQSKERWQNTDMAIALWFYDACIPINAVNSPFFQKAIDQIASMGHGYKAPSYHSLRINLLRDAKKDVQLVVDSFRNTWAETGCTIMGDGWKDSRQRPLINFLVYCPKGISFIKSVDASDMVTNAENLCNLFAEILEMVGPKNVVHLVTDNASNYKAAGTLLNERYPTICWSPCATHCIDLILRDIGDMSTVKSLVTLASTVTIFVYNHKFILNWLRKSKGWKEIIRPGKTQFATTFIALKGVHDHKDSLQALVTSGDYKKFLKMSKGKEVKQIVLDERFWNNCLITVRITGPLIRLLRVCDTDERPSLGYVYDGMFRAITGIKKLFKNKERLYKPYIDIINDRWDRMLRKNLHATAYFLNPAFQYDTATFSTHPEITNGLLDYIESKVDWCNVENLTKEIGMYREREGSFGRKLAILTSKKDRPENWWKLFGCDAPNLQKLAIRVLSQTASSSGCERNWSVFERIHTKKRNSLEHQRLNDLVYVHYNLRLQYRHDQQKRSYDPVDYESVDKTEFWVVEEEQEGELDYELDEEFEELPIHNECSNFEQFEDNEDGAEDVDLKIFQRRNLFVDDEDDDWH